MSDDIMKIVQTIDERAKLRETILEHNPRLSESGSYHLACYLQEMKIDVDYVKRNPGIYQPKKETTKPKDPLPDKPPRKKRGDPEARIIAALQTNGPMQQRKLLSMTGASATIVYRMMAARKVRKQNKLVHLAGEHE